MDTHMHTHTHIHTQVFTEVCCILYVSSKAKGFTGSFSQSIQQIDTLLITYELWIITILHIT